MPTLTALITKKPVKLLFALSAAVFAGVQTSMPNSDVYGTPLTVSLIIAAINIIAAFVLAYHLERRYKLLEMIFKGTPESPLRVKSAKPAIASAVIAAYADWKILKGFHTHFFTNEIFSGKMREIIPGSGYEPLLYLAITLAGLLILPLVFALSYALTSRLKTRSVIRLWRSLDSVEQKFFLTAMLLLSSLIAFIYSQSSMPYAGSVIYNMDSGHVARYFNLYSGWGVSMKRLFHAPVSSPISFTAHIFSDIFYFVPFPSFNYFIHLSNAVVMVSAAILLSRMCCETKGTKAVFLTGYALSYPFLAYLLVMDGYVMATFCVILLMYLYSRENPDDPVKRSSKIAAQAAAGAMSTNIAAFLLPSYDKHAKAWLCNFGKFLLTFLIICIMFGKLPILANAANDFIYELSTYADDKGAGWAGKASQYIAFIGSSLLAPPSVAGEINGAWIYELADPEPVSLSGVAIAALAIAGFIVNRRKRFAQLALTWALYSCIILFVIGWQSTQNEMFLSAFYFGWAYVTLVFMLINKLLALLPRKLKAIKYTLYALIIIAIAFINITGIIDLINFGINHYPM